MTLPIAHAGHYLTTIAYFLPVVAFLVSSIRVRGFPVSPSTSGPASGPGRPWAT